MLKKNGKLRICVDFKKFNVVTKKGPYLLPFTDEIINIIAEHEIYTFKNCFYGYHPISIINIIARHEVYTFLNYFYGYHQISIAPKDKYKTIFFTDWGAFVWVVMPFGVKNGPPTYQREVTKAFHEYINVFMKIFLDYFIIFSDFPLI
jgi:hypothetical protein